MPPRTLMYLLEGKTPDERAAIKAAALSAIVNTGRYDSGADYVQLAKLAGVDYTLDGITVTITGASVSGNCLTVNATASDANGPLPAADNNAYRFVNPPIMHRVDETTANEDVLNTAKRWLLDAILAYARNHGWTG